MLQEASEGTCNEAVALSRQTPPPPHVLLALHTAGAGLRKSRRLMAPIIIVSGHVRRDCIRIAMAPHLPRGAVSATGGPPERRHSETTELDPIRTPAFRLAVQIRDDVAQLAGRAALYVGRPVAPARSSELGALMLSLPFAPS